MSATIISAIVSAIAGLVSTGVSHSQDRPFYSALDEERQRKSSISSGISTGTQILGSISKLLSNGK